MPHVGLKSVVVATLAVMVWIFVGCGTNTTGPEVEHECAELPSLDLTTVIYGDFGGTVGTLLDWHDKSTLDDSLCSGENEVAVQWRQVSEPSTVWTSLGNSSEPSMIDTISHGEARIEYRLRYVENGVENAWSTLIPIGGIPNRPTNFSYAAIDSSLGILSWQDNSNIETDVGVKGYCKRCWPYPYFCLYESTRVDEYYYPAATTSCEIRVPRPYDRFYIRVWSEWGWSETWFDPQ